MSGTIPHWCSFPHHHGQAGQTCTCPEPSSQSFRCPDSNCRAHTQPGKLGVNHVATCGFNDMDADDIRRYHCAPAETESTHVDLLHGKVEMTIGDRRTLEAFAAFLRYAGPVGARRVPLHPEWHAWMTGKGPCPDPESEVGPEPYVVDNRPPGEVLCSKCEMHPVHVGEQDPDEKLCSDCALGVT